MSSSGSVDGGEGGAVAAVTMGLVSKPSGTGRSVMLAVIVPGSFEL